MPQLGLDVLDVLPILEAEAGIGMLRDELLYREIFYTVKEAQILIERWRRAYNTVRPHSALGYHPPAPEAIVVQPGDTGSALIRLGLADDSMASAVVKAKPCGVWD
jgi:hypothetical protein